MRLLRRILLLVALAAGGCGAGPSRPADAAAADAVGVDAAGDADGTGDTGAPADAATPGDAGVPADAAAPGDASNAPCTFNDDCPAAERCECDEVAGCFCRTGPRGTGVCGVDSCVDGNDCQTSLCVEGTGAYYCSCPCTGPGSCGPQLPVCASIAGLGKICIRQ